MVSKSKSYSRLDTLEALLKQGLIPHMKNTVDGNNDFVFCVRNLNISNEFKSNADKLTEELIEIGAQILSLRKKLGEPSDGTMAERLCWYCRQWADGDNQRKRSATVLAKKFLAEFDVQ